MTSETLFQSSEWRRAVAEPRRYVGIPRLFVSKKQLVTCLLTVGAFEFSTEFGSTLWYRHNNKEPSGIILVILGTNQALFKHSILEVEP